MKDPIDFREIIQQCWSELEFEEGWKKVQMMIINPPVDFKGDAIRLEIVFKNLLANGVRYSNPEVDSYINISFEKTHETLVIKVADNGIGIEEEYLEKVFQMFFRGTETSEGSGLGLYIVKQVVDKMEGSIRITSTITEGTTITIALPL